MPQVCARRAGSGATAGARHAPGRGEAGLSLIEVVVAMFVVTMVLTSLVPLQLRAARTLALAQERQQATALANRALEQVRDAATTPARAAAIATGGLAVSPTGSWAVPQGEVLLVAGSVDASLSQLGPTAGTPPFTTRSYVSTRTGDPPSTVWITAVTRWTSVNAGPAGQQVVVRGLVRLGTS